MSSPFRPAEIIAALEAHEVEYVLVGGLALIAHGAVRATLDADLVPGPTHAQRPAGVVTSPAEEVALEAERLLDART